MSFLDLADSTAPNQWTDEKLTDSLQVFSAKLGYRFVDTELLFQALTHRSWCAENGGASNERLEFLGDAVLGLAIADRLYNDLPQFPEGELAKIRATVVSSSALASAARKVGLGEVLLLGRGEADSGGSDKESILADAMEAVIGAVYLDGGQESAEIVVGALFGAVVSRASEDPGHYDHKTRLQELAARHFSDLPKYSLSAKGPDHDRQFAAFVEVGSHSYGPGVGTSKKRAEQAAASLAWMNLKLFIIGNIFID